MHLINWNIQWGRGCDGRVDLARIVEHARALADFDVLCLQEVADNFPALRDNDDSDQFAALAALLPGYTAVEGVAIDLPGGQRRRRFGNMILPGCRCGRSTGTCCPPRRTRRSGACGACCSKPWWRRRSAWCA